MYKPWPCMYERRCGLPFRTLFVHFIKIFRQVKEELAIMSTFAYCKMKEVLLISKGAELIRAAPPSFPSKNTAAGSSKTILSGEDRNSRLLEFLHHRQFQV